MRHTSVPAVMGIVLAFVTGVPAVAIGSSATAGTTALSTGVWAVTPVATATSSNSGTAIAISSLSTKKNSYFWVRNFGTFDTTAFTVSQVVAPTGRSPSVEIRTCSGVWDTTRDTCSGVITTVLTTADGQSGSALVHLPLAINASVQLAAYPTKNGMATTVSTSVDRTAIRPRTVSNG